MAGRARQVAERTDRIGRGGGAECSRLRNRTCSRSRASSPILPTVHYFEFFRTRSPFVGRFLSKYSPPPASMVPTLSSSQPVKEDANGRCTHARTPLARTRTHTHTHSCAHTHGSTKRQQCCINKPWRPVTWSS